MNARPARQRPGTKTLTPKVEDLRVGDQEGTSEAPDSGTPARPNSGARRVRAGSEGLPRYQRMIRTEARLRPDQVRELTDLRRELSRHRADKTERITDNTLVRIAVDLLLAHADELVGDTEDQLRASVVPPG